MKTNRKHGFTIVELVVVIAIIAVLAAVLIPTFTSIIKKANDSAYLQERQSQQIADLAEKVEKINYFTWEDFEKKLAEELAKVDTSNASAIESAVNKAIAKYAENQQSGNTGLTAEQVQKIVNESMKGQLTTAQVEEIVNQAVSKIGGVNVADVQAIVKSAIAGMGQTGLNAKQVRDEITKALSNAGYATDSSVSAAIAQALAKFDTLSEQEVAAIVSQAIKDTIPSEGTIYIDDSRTLEAGKTYILRTQKSIETVALTVPNNTEIERIIIDAPNVKTVNIVYETGATQMIPVKLIEVISTASTSTHINVNATSIEVNKGRAVVGDSATVTVTTVTAAPSTNANVVIELETGATVTNPVIAEYQDNGTGTNDTITIIDNTTSTEGVDVKLTASNELAASGTTTTNVQLQGAKYTDDNIESKIDNKVAETASKVEVVEVTVNDTTYVDAGASTNGYSLFAGGSGTEEDPFLIFDYATMQNISKLYDSGYNYFAVDISKTDNGKIDCSGWAGINLYGSFDGKGVVFKNLDAPLFNKVNSDIPEGVTLKNFNVDNCFIMTGSYYVGAVLRVAYHDVTMEDINISGYLEANSPASFIGQGNFYDTDCTINFIRCHSNMNLVSLNAQAGGFTGNLFGNYYNKNHLCTVNLIDSYFDGLLAVASGSRFSYIECHTASPIAYTISYTNEAIQNNCSSLYSTGQTQAKDVNYLGSTKTLTKGSLSLPAIGSTFTVNKTVGAVSAKAYVIVGLNPGNITGVYVLDEIDLSNVSGETFTTNNVKNYEVVVNDGVHDKTEISENTLYIFNSNFESGYHGITFMVVQYDSLGGIVSVSTTSK